LSRSGSMTDTEEGVAAADTMTVVGIVMEEDDTDQ
jgi:hypothetical protein